MGNCGSNTKLHKEDKDVRTTLVMPHTAPQVAKFCNIVKNLKKALGEEYDVSDEMLGYAALGCSVRKVVHKATGKEYACKTFNIACVKGKKRQAQVRQMLRNEIELVKSLDHPNIISGKEIREYGGDLHFIMELCYGNHLGCYKYTELQACAVVKALLRAVSYVHSSGIVHRDLKMENVLWDSTWNKGRIKIIDFGMSTHFRQGILMSDCVGTPYTMAPEVLRGAYSEKADIWSIGAMTFNLIAGSPAFEMPELTDTVMKIISVSYVWPPQLKISSEAKEFVYHMLKYNPNKRWTLQQALGSRWIRKYDSEIKQLEESSLKLQPNAIHRMVMSMCSYNTYSMFKKTVLLVLACRAERSRIEILSDAFIKFDTDLSGTITMDELKQLLRQDHDVSDEEAAEVFKAVDINNTGRIQFFEFLASTVESVFSLGELGDSNLDEEKLREAFEYMDVDSSGEISVDNMCTLFGPSIPRQEVVSILRGIQNVGDIQHSNNVVDYSSFLKLFCPTRNESRTKSPPPTPKGIRITLSASFDEASLANMDGYDI